MSHNTIITITLVIAALLLAVLLFVAGAMWRGRVTSGPRQTWVRRSQAVTVATKNSSLVI